MRETHRYFWKTFSEIEWHFPCCSQIIVLLGHYGCEYLVMLDAIRNLSSSVNCVALASSIAMCIDVTDLTQLCSIPATQISSISQHYPLHLQAIVCGLSPFTSGFHAVQKKIITLQRLNKVLMNVSSIHVYLIRASLALKVREKTSAKYLGIVMISTSKPQRRTVKLIA